VTWKLVYTKQAQKDAKKLASSGLKPKAQELLALIAEDPTKSHLRLRSSSVILLGPIHAVSTFSVAWCTKCSKKNEW